MWPEVGTRGEEGEAVKSSSRGFPPLPLKQGRGAVFALLAV